MSARSSAGWLILLASLAIPAWMSYQWWSQLNEDARRQMARKVRKRLPRSESIFARPPEARRFVNPLVEPAEAPARRDTAGPAPVLAQAVASPSLSAEPPKAALPEEVAIEKNPAAPEPLPAVSSSPAAAPAAAGEPELARLSRDPTLSPYDLLAIQRAKAKAGLGRQRPARPSDKPRSVERNIDLQGIIETPRGRRAIINDKMVGPGDKIAGAKVVKISSESVMFSVNNKTFIKRMKQ
ncbi:MAG: hypothetical protein HY549_11425 [Elusimicrobia bacterium]|nr:hypothetical protein [Elusimicrobiota bacterium]